MKYLELWNIAFYIQGRLTFGTCLARDFAARFLSANPQSLFSVKPHGEINDWLIPKCAIMYVARSQFGIVNDDFEHQLRLLMPLKNAELISQPLLARLASLPCIRNCI